MTTRVSSCPYLRLPRFLGLLAAALLLPLAVASAQSPPSPDGGVTPPPDASAQAAAQQKLEDTLRSFHPKQGPVALPDGLASLNVPQGFQYLNPEDSRKVIVDLWGNPPQAAQQVLGMLLPERDGLPNVRDWGVIITYVNEGYVKDTDADKINYGEILQQMQKATVANNESRQKAGYEPMELVGWAAPPRYDKASKKIYWAKELKFGDSPTHGLNYDVRILGRRGVLSLNAVAGMDQLQEIEQATPQILGMVNFNEGHRYADFNPKTDKVAEYGLAALVAGGILAKVGGFKLLWIGLLAMKKFIIIGVAAVVGFLRKLFGGGVKKHDTPSTTTTGGPGVT